MIVKYYVIYGSLIFRLCISLERSKVEISHYYFLCNFCFIQYVLSLHVQVLTCQNLLVTLRPNLHSIVIVSYDLFFVSSPVTILKDLAKNICHLSQILCFERYHASSIRDSTSVLALFSRS